MLKVIKLISVFFAKNKGMILIQMLVVAVVMLMLGFMQGYYEYEMQDINKLRKSFIYEADYFMQYGFGPVISEGTLNIIRGAEKLDGVEKVLYSTTNERGGLMFGDSGDSITTEMITSMETPICESAESFENPEIDEDSMLCRNFYIVYENKVSEEEKADVRAYLEENGYYAPVSEAVDEKLNTTVAEIKRQLLIPKIMMGAVNFSCLVITILIIDNRLADYAVYYLCGGGKARICLIGIAAMLLVTAIPCVASCLIIMNFGDIAGLFNIDMSDWAMKLTVKECYICIGSAAAMLVVSGIAQIIMLAGFSPIDLYRRNSL
ncbi:MAG: hypothetical protein NC223_07450 [Butyrivibrio sp.]|nr:hypothetical protein [Butyrivibrio sp.]